MTNQYPIFCVNLIYIQIDRQIKLFVGDKNIKLLTFPENTRVGNSIESKVTKVNQKIYYFTPYMHGTVVLSIF
jgi:hypothetical protein